MPGIDAELVTRLIAAQFPQWADLPVTPVERDGWDNRTFRLGRQLSVRLPSAERYAAQALKEQRWLPWLAPLLPLPIPVPLALGAPAADCPWRWSVLRWLEGESASVAHVADLAAFATSLARFLGALQAADPSGGPPPGAHNFLRGGPLASYDAETRDAIAALRSRIDARAATEVWDAALRATWRGQPTWLHGDVSASNLLVQGGRLCAVIDFGCAGVGDPACDLTIAWTLFAGESRRAFRAGQPHDDATWARARGWALWKALITLAREPAANASARGVVDDVLADHAREG